MNFFERLHERFIVRRRAGVLSEYLAAAIPAGHQRVLDLGCGDGRISSLLHGRRPELAVHGIDVQGRLNAWSLAQLYEGKALPFDVSEFDVVLLIDVLHHVDDPLAILREAVRVAGHAVVIKDHLREGFLAGTRLRFMDWVGNRRFGVPLLCKYSRRREWLHLFSQLEIEVEFWCESLKIYPWPLRPVFDSTLQFVARCRAPKARGPDNVVR